LGRHSWPDLRWIPVQMKPWQNYLIGNGIWDEKTAIKLEINK
jgi:hypothetical protein